MGTKLDIRNIGIIVLILALIGVLYFYNNKTDNLESNLEGEIKLKEALVDSVRFYETENGDLAAEKRTLQGDIDDLLDDNNNLNENQKDLLNTINSINSKWNRDKKVFAAARIQYEKMIDSLNSFIVGATDIDTAKNIVSFVQTDTAAHFIYDLDVIGVRPNPITINPDIRFNEIDFPNEQNIFFNWDKNERKDYPVSFTVTNSNKYYKVNNIESYAIPELNKNEIDPNGWQKVWRWVKVNGKYILVGAAGFTIGAVATGN